MGLHGKSSNCRESQRITRKVSGLHGQSAYCKENLRIARKFMELHGNSADCKEIKRPTGKVSGLQRKSADYRALHNNDCNFPAMKCEILTNVAAKRSKELCIRTRQCLSFD